MHLSSFIIRISCLSISFVAAMDSQNSAVGYPILPVGSQEALALKQRFLENSIEILEKNRELTDDFEEEWDEIMASAASGESEEVNIKLLRDYVTLIQSYERKSPIFLLNEYECDGWLLNRLDNALPRERFEQYAADELQKKLSIADRAVDYTSFCAGRMFKDMCILAKTLERKSNAKIDLHLIDGEYGHSVSIKGEPMYYPAGRRHGNHYETEIIVDILKKRSRFGEIDRTMLQIALSIIRTNSFARQMMNWLNAHYPQAQLTLSLYDTLAKYKQYQNDRYHKYPDIVIAADLEDSYYEQQYNELCRWANQKNHDSSNMLLGVFKSEKKGIIPAIVLNHSNTITKISSDSEMRNQKEFTHSRKSAILLLPDEETNKTSSSN